jgi:hypothetical protein
MPAASTVNINAERVYVSRAERVSRDHDSDRRSLCSGNESDCEVHERLDQ